MFFMGKNTVDKWFMSLTYTERKLLLSDLHYLRRTLSKDEGHNLRELIYKLEELHDKTKLLRGYL